MEQTFRIKALKYGELLHYEWDTDLLEEGDGYVFVLGRYGRKLQHHTKQSVFTVNNWSIEFFSSKHWFTVSAGIVDGQINEYYCNINMPAVKNGNEISFIDLDLDLVQRGGKWMVIDEDEFAENAGKFGYPEQLIRQVREELAALEARVAAREFPFDGTIERLMAQIPQQQELKR
ncbi:DUF402 domain-containing protein [Paenibacillus glycanilyticus]|uniref:DUF402 domain-containing protein n=1 Tax=Paenibacillus glycanilyticus TaxID=126569 RepID=A0ABQ6G621_9BACL|nr:DUF402 domain-containing protein [Paenibacillus glycanilyticus]GLX65750.1 DUF402 domain-containing protein [Paenibacillus glycanilyticus]